MGTLFSYYLEIIMAYGKMKKKKKKKMGGRESLKIKY